MSDPHFTYIESYLDEKESKVYFDKLMNELDFKQHNIVMYDKEIPEPRLKTFHTNKEDLTWNYTGSDLKATRLTPTLQELLERVSTDLEIEFNSVLCNLYRNGNDHIGFHFDKESLNPVETHIGSLSLGATRKFRFRKIKETSGWEYDIDLKAGDFVLMMPTCQKTYKHSIIKQPKIKEPRINLTFRQF